MRRAWEFLIRWRTWLVNAGAGLLLVLPDIVLALLGFDWATILPREWMPYITLAIIVLNVWMRPRPAVIASDPEAEVSRLRKTGPDFKGEL